jgi:hypothetical protein
MDIAKHRFNFMQGVNNKEYLERKYNVSKGKKYIFMHISWLFLLFLFSPHKKNSGVRSTCVKYNKLDDHILDEVKCDDTLYLGNFIKKFQDIKKRNTIFSLYNFPNRVNNIVNSLIVFKRAKISPKYIGLWIEYYFMNLYLEKVNPKEVICAGHFDRYATWCSYICETYSIKYTIYQHGVITREDLPSKIFCSEFFLFNDQEKEFAKDIIMNPEICSFKTKDFKSQLTFANKSVCSHFVIAVASQDLHTNLTIDIIEYIAKRFNNCNVHIYVYPHYRENVNRYVELQHFYDNIEVYQDERHTNVNLLITFYSTIVYDFLSVNDQIDVICYKIPNIEVSYYNYHDVSLVDSFEGLYQEISKLINFSKNKISETDLL